MASQALYRSVASGSTTNSPEDAANSSRRPAVLLSQIELKRLQIVGYCFVGDLDVLQEHAVFVHEAPVARFCCDEFWIGHVSSTRDATFVLRNQTIENLPGATISGDHANEGGFPLTVLLPVERMDGDAKTVRSKGDRLTGAPAADSEC